MKAIKIFWIRYNNIFYSILSAVLIVSWIIFSTYSYFFIFEQKNTLIWDVLQIYVTVVPSSAIYYFLGEYRIYHRMYNLGFEESPILDDFLLKNTP